jgi:GNAT superfamily N-acetyltransferase
MSLQIAALREEHLQDAAGLVVARYKALRERLPILAPRYAEADVIVSLLRRLVGQMDGVVALQGSRLVGFLWGLVIPEFLGKRTAYSPEWANAAELEESRRIYEEMYAGLAARWVAGECFTHAVTLLAHDRQGIGGWQWLGFGLANVDGVRALRPVEGGAAEVDIRRAGVQDARAATALVAALERHVAAAPIFWIHELACGEDWLRQPANALWLAYKGEEVVGFIGLEPGHGDGCEIVQGEDTAGISGAFTQESARGKGIATALLNRALEWAQAQGYARCAVDFETMNVPAVRFWMKWFDPVCYSLVRCIDERAGQAPQERGAVW